MPVTVPSSQISRPQESQPSDALAAAPLANAALGLGYFNLLRMFIRHDCFADVNIA
jgi:hypothetical protein